MPGTGKVTGGAHDATVVVQNNVAAIEALLARAREEERTRFYVDQVARMRSKLERAKADVVAAEQSLADAEAELVVEEERVARVTAERERIEALPEAERELALAAADDQAKAEREARRARDAEERAKAKAAAAAREG